MDTSPQRRHGTRRMLLSQRRKFPERVRQHVHVLRGFSVAQHDRGAALLVSILIGTPRHLRRAH